MVTWSQCVKCCSKWVRENRLYNIVYMCMMYCVRFHGPDHFSRIAHVHEERGKGREGH